MGSRSKIDIAYIAGFLDGDGSLMLQLKKRKDGKLKWRFMGTICFYQDSRHEKPLSWIRKVLSIGYLSKRNDGISELRINGFAQISDILENLQPFIRFKKIQAAAMITAMNILSEKAGSKLTEKDLRKLVECMMTVQNSNYMAKRKKTRKELLKILDLTP